MSRRREFFLPPMVLDRGSGTPLQRQIYYQLAAAIRSGAAGSGARLPSTRMLAKLLGVSRNTVLAAYEDLAAEGLVCGERGSGMRVAGSAAGPAFFGLTHVIRAAGYPAKVLVFSDPDGNPLYLNR
ncbi:MAG TPA: winged helix-turn-helix domain-containing protein [Bryobacteraceae bacterium]|nr:winged helix-turn-helix domain-containing protein [Bryobacteraceae bacterium]